MMSFLKAFGQIAVQVLRTAVGLAPVIQSLIPDGSTAAKVENEFIQIAQSVLTVEQVALAVATTTGTPMTGAQKLAAAKSIVHSIMLQSPLVQSMKIQSPDLFEKSCGEFAQAACDLMNSFHADSVKVVEANT